MDDVGAGVGTEGAVSGNEHDVDTNTVVSRHATARNNTIRKSVCPIVCNILHSTKNWQ